MKTRETLDKEEKADGDGFDIVRRFDFLGDIHCDVNRKDGFLATETAEGFLIVDARLTRTGVFLYGDSSGNVWGEYRDESEVFDDDALESFKLSTLTNDHPAEFVNLDNRKDVDVGTIGTDVRRDGRYVRATIVVRDADTIRAIKDGKTQLSCGYTAVVVQQDGVAPDGTPFKARQTNIRGNHVAVVDRGRAGPECGLMLAKGDAFTQLGDNPMKMKKIKIGDTEYTVPESVAGELKKSDNAILAKALHDAHAKKDEEETSDEGLGNLPPALRNKAKEKMKENEEDEEAEDEKSKDSASELRGRLAALEAQSKADDASFTSRVDARVALVSSVREIVGSDVKTDGVSDVALMVAVIDSVLPSMKEDIKAHKKDAAFIRGVYTSALETHRTRADAVKDSHETLFGASYEDSEEGDTVGDAYMDYLDRLTQTRQENAAEIGA